MTEPGSLVPRELQDAITAQLLRTFGRSYSPDTIGALTDAVVAVIEAHTERYFQTPAFPVSLRTQGEPMTEPASDRWRDALARAHHATRRRTPDPDTLSTVELCDAAGLSYRQVDYWVRLGRIEPISNPRPGSGRERRFNYRTLRDLIAVTELTRAGVALHRAWEIVQKVGRLTAWDRIVYVDEGNRITDQPTGPVTLRVDLAYLDTHTALDGRPA